THRDGRGLPATTDDRRRTHHSPGRDHPGTNPGTAQGPGHRGGHRPAHDHPRPGGGRGTVRRHQRPVRGTSRGDRVTHTPVRRTHAPLHRRPAGLHPPVGRPTR